MSRQRPSVFSSSSDPHDPVTRGLQEAFLKSKDELLSQRAAEEITTAYAAVLAQSSDWILDERLLPYPKDVIRLAFQKRISFWKVRCREDPNNSEWKNELNLCEVVALRVADFQPIDQVDEAAVLAANEWYKQLRIGLAGLRAEEKEEYKRRAVESEERIATTWAPLFLKYLERTERSMKEMFP